MINKIKETLSQVFSSKDSTKLPFWDESDIECAIDEDVVDCKEMEEEPYVGVPAPAYLKDDKWFGTAVVSEKGQDYMVQETEIKEQQAENRQYWTKEPENIHQVMYELATKSGATTVQLDPIGGSENFQGGSENVHR